MDMHNEQVMRVMDLLGQTGAGRRAVLKAIASKQGITEDDDLEKLYEGKSERKYHCI